MNWIRHAERAIAVATDADAIRISDAEFRGFVDGRFRAGDNLLDGKGGADTLTGGAGNDTIQGGVANDEIYGDWLGLSADERHRLRDAGVI